MDKFKNTCWAILFLILLSFVAISAWKILAFFVTQLITLDPKIAVPVIGAMTTAFITLAAAIITQRQTKLREREEAHREKKIEIYQKFIDLIAKITAGESQTKIIEKPTEDELTKALYDYKKDILLWCSANVIKTQLNFQRITPENNNNILFAVDKMYKAIREDIGLSNTGLPRTVRSDVACGEVRTARQSASYI